MLFSHRWFRRICKLNRDNVSRVKSDDSFFKHVTDRIAGALTLSPLPACTARQSFPELQLLLISEIHCNPQAISCAVMSSFSLSERIRAVRGSSLPTHRSHPTFRTR